MLIKPKNINCIVNVPYSKSEFLRACLIAMLRGNTIIHNIPTSSDAQTGFAIVQKFTNCDFYDNKITVIKPKSNDSYYFDCVESAFLARSLAAISVLMSWDTTIIGSGTLENRNLSDIYAFLKLNNIEFEGNLHSTPIRIYPNQNISKLIIDGRQSSQLLSGALIGNAFQNEPKFIYCKDYVSKGYVDLTLDFLQKAGIKYNYNGTYFSLERNNSNQPINYEISGDWSAAAFVIVAGLIAGKTVLKNLSLKSIQPDSIILDFVKKIGANVKEIFDGNNYELICEKSEIPAFEIDLTNNPDLIPPIVVLALNSNGMSKIKGISRLVNKESDRRKAILEEFARIGAKIKCENDTFVIDGNIKLNGGEVSSHNDHRIAMALAIAALKTKSGIVLDNPASVNKSYPNFWNIFL